MEKQMEQKCFSNGVALKNEGKFKSAILEFTNCIILDETNSLYRNYRALCNLSLNEFELAIIDATKAISISKNPKEKSLSFNTRAKIYSVKGEHLKAINDYSESCEFHPSDAFFERGCIYFFNLKEYSKALSDFHQVLIFQPNNHVFLLHVGLAYYNLQDYKKAKEYLEEAVKNGSTNAKEILNEMYL